MQLTHAYIRIDDFNNIRSNANAKLVAAGVRNDGSIIVAKRSTAGRVISWIKRHLGQRDEAAEALAQVFCRQLISLGATGRDALSVSGIAEGGRAIKLQQARHALNHIVDQGLSPKTSEAAVYSAASESLRQRRSDEIRQIQSHLSLTPATEKFLIDAITTLNNKYGDFSGFEKSQIQQMTIWLAAEKSLALINKYPDIPVDTLRQKAVLEIANELGAESSFGIKTLLCLFGKNIGDAPRFVNELAGTIPEDTLLNFAWAASHANLKGDENVGGLFHFVVDRMIDNSQPLPAMFSPEDLWVHCFDSHPQQLDTLLWRDDFYKEIDEWISNNLSHTYASDEARQIEAKTKFVTYMQLLGLSGKDAIDLIVDGPKSLDSDQARYGLKLTNTSWASKTLDQCKKIVSGDIKRLYSNPKVVSTVSIAHESGAIYIIELDNVDRMSESEKIVFKNGSLDNHPVLAQLENELTSFCVSEDQIKGVLSGISANSQVIFVPLSSAFNPLAAAAGKPQLAGEHSACSIRLKKLGNDVLLSLKPLGVDWLDCEVEYRIGASGDGVLTHYHARTELISGEQNA